MSEPLKEYINKIKSLTNTTINYARHINAENKPTKTQENEFFLYKSQVHLVNINGLRDCIIMISIIR